MSSKVLRAGHGAAAQLVVWPAAEGGKQGETAARNPRAPSAAVAPKSPLPSGAAEEMARELAAVRAESARHAEQAHAAGYREGEASGRRAAEDELRPVMDRLTRSIEEIDRLQPVLVAQAEASLLKLAVAIARRILHRELSLDTGALAGIVRSALDRVQREDVCRVRVHPADAPSLGAAFANTAGGGIQVEADPSLERGAVIVETGCGKLDASVDTQLLEIERGLADRLRRGA